MFKEYQFNGVWYYAVPINELPHEVEESAVDSGETADEAEARIATALSVLLWKRTKRYNPHGLQLKAPTPTPEQQEKSAI